MTGGHEGLIMLCLTHPFGWIRIQFGKGTCGLFRRPWRKQAAGKITLFTDIHDSTGLAPVIAIVLC